MGKPDEVLEMPLYLQISRKLANEIESGLYTSGQKIPSIRSFAREYGVSNSTVQIAYQHLVDRGYVAPTHGKGFDVCDFDHVAIPPITGTSPKMQAELEAMVRAENDEKNKAIVDYDFSFTNADKTLFPFYSWARTARKILRRIDEDNIPLYDFEQGIHELRVEIARYLKSERNIDCIPEQILIGESTRTLIAEIVSLFDRLETVIAIEDFCNADLYSHLTFEGYRTEIIPSPHVLNWEEELTHLENADILITRPLLADCRNHGMPAETSEKKAAWAAETQAYLICDEYCWEYGLNIPHEPSLASFDSNGRVIIAGSFTNSFYPPLHLGYAVLPPKLLKQWKEGANTLRSTVAWQTQACVASFMREGFWKEHAQRIRAASHRKRAVLTKAISAHLGSDFDVIESCSNYFLVRARDGRSEDDLIRTAEQAGIRVYPTSRFWCVTPPDDWRYVLIGFSGISELKIEPGIKALAKAWGATPAVDD